jgi:hypothetical protein
MKYAVSVTVAALLSTLFVHPADAQPTALTNVDIIRLVTLHVSDETVISVIHEAKTTQFDVSSPAVTKMAVYGVEPAVIDAMRRSSTSVVLAADGAASPPHSPTAGILTIAEASAEAAKTTHEWPTSPNTGPKYVPRSNQPATTATSPVRASGPTDAQLASVEDSGRRSQLREAQKTYHDGKRQLAETMRNYAALCRTVHEQVQDSCQHLWKGFTFVIPDVITAARNLIIILATALHMDPTSALEDWWSS